MCHIQLHGCILNFYFYFVFIYLSTGKEYTLIHKKVTPSFHWYAGTVYPQASFPLRNVIFTVATGMIDAFALH
jgi:hypothetical protein